MKQHRSPRRRVLACASVAIFGLMGCGCNSFFNSWFDPTQVGNFSYEGTTEIRSALSIQDTPGGIAGAVDPRPEDLIPVYEEYRVQSGDVLSVRIFELLARNTETTAQASVDEIGTVALPALGQVRVAGMTRSEITQELKDLLRERGLIQDATLIVEIPVKRDQTYIVFGAISGANLYPLPRPDTRLLEALNTAGGLIDTATEVYVIRTERREDMGAPTSSAWPGRGEGVAPTLSDGLAGAGAGAAYAYAEDPPADADVAERVDEPSDEEQALLEAVAPSAAESETVESIDERPAPAGQPRWMFVNGQWVETTAPPAESPAAAPDMPTSETPVEEAGERPTEAPPRYALPEERAVDRTLPQPPDALPQIDWDRLAGETEQRVIRVSAQALRDGDYRQNIVVRKGDSIRVVAGQVGEYYIMGQVGRPGAYTITGRQVTLKTAIASAGNLAPLAWPDRCTIYRRYGDREEMHQANLDAIFAGKEPDIMLKNNDLILVGTHPVAPFLAVFRNAFRMTYGFGFVYDRNFADIDSYGSKINPSNIQSGTGNSIQNLFR